MSKSIRESATITWRRDPLRAALWAAGIVLAAVAAAVSPGASVTALRGTAGPFATLAAIILASALASQLGAFKILARGCVPENGPPIASAAAILAFTATISGLVNLDVGVVVAMPVALQAADSQHLPADRLAVAITANATSFLLPTANITNLLLLSQHPQPALSYLSRSWLPWLLVGTLTVVPLAVWAGRRGRGHTRAVAAGPSPRPLRDLIPMFLIASGIRALLGTGLLFDGGLTSQLAAGTALASVAGNLPAAAAIHPATATALCAAILATTIGPNLLLTGSVATLITRRIARDGGASLSGFRFTAAGLVLVPAQLAAAVAGLHMTGAFA